MQKRAPAAFSVPQLGQITASVYERRPEALRAP
jgi:hypothetical protein